MRRPSSMHSTVLALSLAHLVAACASTPDATSSPAGDSSRVEVVPGIVLAIHGGAGTIRRSSMTPELDAEYRAKLTEALEAGYAVLQAGGSALDAVEATIHPMEDSPLFNSGRGAVLTADGHVEMDSSIMNGADGMAGAVAGARTPRHPISVARAVMQASPHVLLSGSGADQFAGEQGLEQMDPGWFITPRRQKQLDKMKAREDQKTAGLEASPLDHKFGPLDHKFGPLDHKFGPLDHKFGTVGCVALDGAGHVAAGTSTGGMARKAWGRIGDSPIVGAGTWADDRTCAISCTGHGEFFIRKAIAHQIHARMLFGGADLADAARITVMEDLPIGGGSGGCVALGADGTLVAPFTTTGMYRGWVDSQGKITVRIHGDERP